LSPRYRERVVTFGEQNSLVGLVTLPVQPRAHAPVVIFLNSGIIHHVGPHRSYVMFARALASEGVPVLRFDLSGIGDSERQARAVPLQESVRHDIASALDFLAASYKAERFVLGGLCSGAFDAFEYAQLDARVTGACLIDLPGAFRNWSHIALHVADRALRPTSWANLLRRLARRARRRTALPVAASDDAVVPGGQVDDLASAFPMPGVRGLLPPERIEADLDTLLGRGVRLAFVFTGGVEDQYNHRLQFRLRFPRAAAHPALTTDFIPWSDHTFSTRDSRDYLTRFLCNWVLAQA
jgi:dienelactone hydrolase